MRRLVRNLGQTSERLVQRHDAALRKTQHSIGITCSTLMLTFRRLSTGFIGSYRNRSHCKVAGKYRSDAFSHNGSPCRSLCACHTMLRAIRESIIGGKNGCTYNTPVLQVRKNHQLSLPRPDTSPTHRNSVLWAKLSKRNLLYQPLIQITARHTRAAAIAALCNTMCFCLHPY